MLTPVYLHGTLLYRILSTPPARSLSAMPGRAMAPMAVPLMSKCSTSPGNSPPGDWSVITMVTGWPEHAALVVHFTS
ncbi:hypothetical protein Zm00014a_006231 [Zea mays]|uniref:Uncharacterized protein n=1 Tax=Zea mays TaxID=4577 RepID=A0A3L6E496_MAIZE|nr:hypothetical protein Zm00014a_006231 [Zea mays]